MRFFYLPIVYTCAAFAMLAAVTSVALRELVLRAPRISAQEAQAREALYLPSGKGLEVISFGYKNALSHALWFNTINYFGKHHRGDQNYHWLAHMCGLVTDLNPRALHVYEFCGTMLAWEANDAQASVTVLSKAIAQFPDLWNLHYQRGFVHMFFLKDEQRAQEDFLKASTLPGAHALIKRLAAKGLTESDNAQTAVDFLSDMLRRGKDPAARDALESRLREAHYELDFATIERAREVFNARHGAPPKSLQEIIAAGILQSELKDPFGGTYVLDPESGEIKSTSAHKRIFSKSRKQ